MSQTNTVTRSATAAAAGDSGAGTATFERDAETGIITFGGQNRQLWVLVYEGSEKSDVPTCGAIYTSGTDGGSKAYRFQTEAEIADSVSVSIFTP